jgi:hypothetical protein
MGMAGGLLLLFGVQNLIGGLWSPGDMWPFPITLPLLSLLVGLFVLFVKRQSSSKDAVSSASIALIVLGVAVLRFFGAAATVDAVAAARAVTLPGLTGSVNLLQVMVGAAIFIAGLATAPLWLRLHGLASSIVWSVVTLTGALFYVSSLYWLQHTFLRQPTTVQMSLLSKPVLVGAVVSAIVFLSGVATAQRWRTWHFLSALIAWTLFVFGGFGALKLIWDLGVRLEAIIEVGNTSEDPKFFNDTIMVGEFIARLLYMCGVCVFVLWARRRERTVR